MADKKGPASYPDHLKKVKKKAAHHLKKSVRDFETKKFRKHCKAISSRLETLNSKTVLSQCTAFINEKEKHIKAHLKRKVIKTALLHEIRKNLKAIKAVQKICHETNHKSRSQKNHKPLTQLEDAIGKWHDKAVLLEDVRSFAEKKGNNKRLSLFITNLHRETEASYKDSVKLLKHYFA